MRSILLLLVILVAAFVMAIRMLPWWGVLALVAALVGAAPTLLKWGLMRLLKAPFKAKGAVLGGARVEVHSIERAEPPATGPDSEDEAAIADIGTREHYRLDVTITPKAPSGPFTLWEPGELRMVDANTKSGEPEADETEAAVSALEVENDGHFLPDDGMKYGGPLRLRLLVAARPGQRGLRFRYYFEVFGDVALPASQRSNGVPSTRSA